MLDPSLTTDNAGNKVFDRGAKIAIEEVSLDSGLGRTAVGLYGQFKFGGDHTWLDVQYRQSLANTLYPPLREWEGETPLTLDECTDPKAFLSFNFGTRSASPTLQAAKVFVQSNPLQLMMQPGFMDAQRHNMR